MPKPVLAIRTDAQGNTVYDGTAYDLPPVEIQAVSPELYDYLLMLHVRTFGVPGDTGDLDTDNINGQLTDTTDHNSFTNVTAYQHHGTDNHGSLVQGTAVSDSTAAASSTVSVDTANAGATYGGNEQALLNELKADVNQLVTDMNAVVTAVGGLVAQVNALLASLRAAGVIAA